MDFKAESEEVSRSFDVEILSIKYEKNHFHMIFKAKPTLDIPKYINIISNNINRNS
ncbi:MAG: transposase [Candidatus Methanomethylicia archaeon]